MEITRKIKMLLPLSLFMLMAQLWAVDVVALHPNGKDFIETLNGVKQNLGDDVQLANVSLEKKTEWPQIRDKVNKMSPKLFLLMDNQSVNIYKQYIAESQKKGVQPVKAVALMALQLDKISEGMTLSGISYEIPVVTSVVNLRAVSSKPVKKIGVIYRKSWSDFVKVNAEFCKMEKAELIGFSIDDNESNPTKAIQKGIKQLISDKKVDAIWILNDNALLNNQTISKAWIPGLAKVKIPVIVGVEVLVQTKFNLGSFAVLPDHTGLGGQVADMIFDIKDNDWVIEDRQIDQPLSVIKVLNSTLARKKGFLKEEGLKTVDKEVH